MPNYKLSKNVYLEITRSIVRYIMILQTDVLVLTEEDYDDDIDDDIAAGLTVCTR
jgi:hypothetical protein